MQISFFGEGVDRLGESPVWDNRCGWLWWVDIARRRLLAADVGGAPTFERTYDDPVCSIGLAQGGLIAAFADRFALIDGEGDYYALAQPDIGAPSIRFNDGKADRQGRFVAGTMQQDDAVGSRASVWQLADDGSARQIEGGLKLTNSICFSPDGRWLYLSDTLEAVIRRYPYDPVTGLPGPMERFFDCAAINGHPDGATVDADGRLWVALVTTGELACISPDGVLLRRIAVPVPHPACPAFGGPGMATLYITSISDSGHRLRSNDPAAGRVLAIGGLDAHGIPEAICSPCHHTGD